MGGTVTCDRCGTPVPPGTPDGQAPADWSSGIERGRRDWLCERCVRDNARSIEGKLDPSWWSRPAPPSVRLRRGTPASRAGR